MSAPATTESVASRFTALAQTLQFAWFVGHFTLLCTTAQYSFACAKFSGNGRFAAFNYRLAFVSAAATYGIVVYKAYRARMRAGQMPMGVAGALKVLGDENVQYLLMALVWLYSKQVYFALLPFAVYSTFHFLTYARTNLIPTISPPTTPPSTNLPTTISTHISNFVKKNYDSSMHLVANLELLLWVRVFLYCLVFKNSWILLGLYTAFLRARYSQSQFIREGLWGAEIKIDGLMANGSVPDPVRNGWNVAKGIVRSFGEATDSKKVASAAGAAPKKAE